MIEMEVVRKKAQELARAHCQFARIQALYGS